MITLFEYVLPSFLTGFLLFGFVRMACHWLKQDNEKAMGQAFMTREQYVQECGLKLAHARGKKTDATNELTDNTHGDDSIELGTAYGP